MSTEIFKLIELSPSYSVSNFGNVMSLNFRGNGKPNLLKIRIHKSGYATVKILKWIRVHQLVAKAFIPNPENKKCVNHINGIKTDNRVENLEWCTHSENTLHAYRLNLMSDRNGVNNSQAKLTEEQVISIRKNVLNLTQSALAELYNTSQSRISSVIRNETYKNIGR